MGECCLPWAPALVAATAAAAAAAARAAGREARLRRRPMHCERGELLQHLRRAARRALDDLAFAADELLEMLLALHARVLVHRHGPSVTSAHCGAMDFTGARRANRPAGAAHPSTSRRPLGGVARPADLALAAGPPAAHACRDERMAS